MSRRGARVAPPPAPGHWELRFADDTAAEGWERLVENARSAALACYDALSADPVAWSNRMKPLRGTLSRRAIAGRVLGQWQYEATGGGRVWYCPDGDRRIVWITDVSLAAPKRTHRTKGAG